MAHAHFSHEIDRDGITLRLKEKRLLGHTSTVPVVDWADRMSDQAFSGISRILALADSEDSGVDHKEDGLSIDHATIASLSEPQAFGLGLPPSVRATLQVNTKNLITDPDFEISSRWVGEANRPLRVERKGAFLFVEGVAYRIPEPMFSLTSAIESFKSDARDDDARMGRLAHLQSILPKDAQDQLSIDKYFLSFRVMHASAFSLSLKAQGHSFDFDPILFGRRVIKQREAEGDTLGPVSEAESLLTDHQQDIFAKQRFRFSDIVKPSYVIERGVYLYLDPSLRAAMNIVRQMQLADTEARKRFVQAPQLYLKESLSNILADDEIERLFVETEQYSARVIDIGVWTPPVLPWIKKDPNDWLPEKFGLQVGGQYLVLKTEEIAPLRELIREARERNEEFVEFGEPKTRIPASRDTEDSLSQLWGAVAPTLEPEPNTNRRPASEPTSEKRVLIVEENFDKLGFTRKITPRLKAATTIPAAIRPALKKHQQFGLNWLQDTWAQGYAGVLLADDMGLGKTLQALSFLAWLREISAEVRPLGQLRGPILIVAPTGLLANWEKEHNLHLHAPGLGELCRAYGRHLKNLKAASIRDIDSGGPSLDHRRIQQANWVLTTYETLRDYHLSFAAIRFSCAVFDEMQKVKSPSSLLTRAAKTLNADFTVGLTGTPIENQLADLWCIMDIINPGFLSDLKTFTTRYPPEDHDALKRLHTTLLATGNETLAPMLRRMKADELDGLPERRVHIRKRQMPEAQARIYADIVTRAKEPHAGPMLQTLHLLRGVSLHPIWPPAGEIKDQRSFIDQSARLLETFAILDEVVARNEKVLIFLESLDLQEHLALMIKSRYGLKRRPMQVNGEVGGERRQALVDEFQTQRGTFDVMILSPRAGGVGLTLTTANHVIHLSRWWNPAVEDQCTDRVYRIGQDQTVHVYYPMAVHPVYGESSFDELLNSLLRRKRDLSRRMLLPPVNVRQDQQWFADNLGRKNPDIVNSPIDIDEIDVMEPTAFERWALGLCISFGWEAYRTPQSYDGGADGVLVHRVSGARAIVQCKHTQNDKAACGPEAIDDLLRARTNYAAAARLFVLSNAERFARSAHERAEMHGIQLIGRKELLHWPRQLLS